MIDKLLRQQVHQLRVRRRVASVAEVGRVDEAEREYRAAYDAEQEPGRKHFRRGQWLVKFHPERLDEAEHEFEAASELLPDWSLPRNALAQARALRRRGG